MQDATDNLIPILFKVLFGFVALNVLINFILLYIRRQRINKLLAWFWPGMLVTYILQGIFQTGNLAVSLAFFPAFFSSLIAGFIGFEAVGRKFPWQKYLFLTIPALTLPFIFNHLGYGFTTIAMPISILAALPTLHSAYYLNLIDYNKSTKLQKLLGLIYIVQAIHAVNFAIFRMEPGAQIWGWIISYVTCDVLAILLPSITLEVVSITESDRLMKLVDQRTDELNKSLKTNQSLFKVLLHDISNPMMVMKGYIHMLSGDRPNKEFIIGKTQKAQMTMEEIINQMKKLYINKGITKDSLGPVPLHDCFEEIAFIFEQPLMHKNIKLVLNNQLPKECCVRADHISLTHSVLSNLVSNGIKFNPANSQVEIIAKEDGALIIIEIHDEGPGMSEEKIRDFMLNKELQSTEGSNGERGSGLGLSIAKSFVDSYGGTMKFEPKERGSCVRLSLQKA